MGIKTKTIAPFIAAAATAQGAYDEIAQECVADLAEELELNDLASDGVITADEMENYFAFAELLGIDDEKASGLFDDFVEEADDLEIEA